MKALIVEDEKSLACALKELLRKNCFDVDVAYDGECGFNLAEANLYDVILLDIMLPKINGLDVLKMLRKDRISTPVLVLTARDRTSDKVEGLNFGADDYLTKPFDGEELIARINAMTRRKGEVSGDELQFGDVVLHQGKLKLSGSKTDVELGLKEYQLMELLFINSSQILTKERIIEKLWGFDGDAEYNNVEVYISFLRKKLSLVSYAVTIRTVRGVGYIMEKRND